MVQVHAFYQSALCVTHMVTFTDSFRLFVAEKQSRLLPGTGICCRKTISLKWRQLHESGKPLVLSKHYLLVSATVRLHLCIHKYCESKWDLCVCMNEITLKASTVSQCKGVYKHNRLIADVKISNLSVYTTVYVQMKRMSTQTDSFYQFITLECGLYQNITMRQQNTTNC